MYITSRIRRFILDSAKLSDNIILICDREKIIFSTNETINTDFKLSDEYIKLVSYMYYNDEMIKVFNKNKINILKEKIDKINSQIILILEDSKLGYLGSIIFLNYKKSYEDFDFFFPATTISFLKYMLKNDYD